MPANFKDYPLYVYDDPAIYTTFSGGINTNPSNEHLDDDEMRDCLNMHYNSAGLIKRPGAKQLCTIVCSEELFNIQGVFIFTYKIPYLIIAANGKLYYGLYNENIKTSIERLYIYSTNDNTLNYNSPFDMTTNLDLYYKELNNELHDGYICRGFYTKQGKLISLDDTKLYDLFDDVKHNQIIGGSAIFRYNGRYFIKTNYTKIVRKPDDENSPFWIKVSDSNITNPEYVTLIKNYYVNHPESKQITFVNNCYVISPNITNIWIERVSDFQAGEIVEYKNVQYLCITTHNCLLQTPSSKTMEEVYYKDSIIFQNKKPIEVATYNNKCYIATGTRFTEVYLLNNQLQAFVVQPYKCSYNEIYNLGNNLLSPYPEYCIQSLYNQATTSLQLLIPVKNSYGAFTLMPIAIYAGDLTEKDMIFKWEKYVDNKWVTIISYQDNYSKAYKGIDKELDIDEVPVYPRWERNHYYEPGDIIYTVIDNGIKIYECTYRHNLISTTYSSFRTHIEIGGVETEIFKEIVVTTTLEEALEEIVIKKDCSTLVVNDADVYKYRVSFCESLKLVEVSDHPIYDLADAYVVDDIVYVEDGNQYLMYKCLYSHIPSQVFPDAGSFFDCMGFVDKDGNKVVLWEKISSTIDTSFMMLDGDCLKIEMIDKYSIINGTPIIYKSTDFVPDKLTGAFGQAVSSIYQDVKPHTLFDTIQSCSSITIDGNKLLLYNDAYNSGSWYKTKVDNPYYISEKGCLSFKTTKNESLIKVVSFSNNLIAFANTENIGGSIHLITGNGDDYDRDEYYSPYKRTTVSEAVTCNNAKTIQVCENYLFFKYFNTIYFIVSSELSNDVVTIYSANDKIKLESPYVTIPWDDNTCISEATEDYYAIIWKEKYSVTDQGLLLDHPAMKLKLYYKLAKSANQKVYFPWLRDESKYFNIDNIVYIKGKPVYLYNNLLLSFDSNNYKDLNESYKCLIHFKGVDTNYPKLLKVLSNVLVYYYNKPTSSISLQLKTYNEAGNLILDSTNQKRTLQNLRTLKVGTKLEDNNVKTDYITVSSKVFNTTYKFPYLLAESVLEADTEDLFALSSMTYIYTSMDTPDSTIYDTYTKIIRKKEI